MTSCVFEFLPCLGDGGAETLVKDYCLFINKNLIKLVVVTVTPPIENSACYRVMKANGIEILSIYKKNKISKSNLVNRLWGKLFDTLYVANHLKDLVKQYNPVTIHAHLSVLRYLKKTESSLKGIRILATCHNEFDKNFNIPIELKSAEYLIRKERIQFIALHKKMQVEINRRFKCNNTVIVNNAIDFNRFINNFSKESIRQKIDIPLDSFVIGHVGRFNDVKNHSFLIDVFVQVRRRIPNAFLLMIGNGANKEMILKKLKDLQLLENSLILSDRDDVNVLLKSMDVFVFPSLYEGLPVSLVEAQVAGLRCVVSDTIIEDCFFSENIIALSLSDSAERWADYVLNSNLKSNYQNDIYGFDINKEIHKLENLYLGIC